VGPNLEQDRPASGHPESDDVLPVDWFKGYSRSQRQRRDAYSDGSSAGLPPSMTDPCLPLPSWAT
jgi:hypothetical protein